MVVVVEALALQLLHAVHDVYVSMVSSRLSTLLFTRFSREEPWHILLESVCRLNAVAIALD